MNRGVLERVKSQETVHFTAETPSTELSFRIIHSANQFSMYGAVWSWSGEPSPNETEPILEKSWQVKNPSKRYAEECEFTGNKLSGGFC